MKTFFQAATMVLVAVLLAGTATATPAVGVQSFEDGTTTLPVEMWYSPGSVANVAGGHQGTRAVAATGNVRIKLTPAATDTRLAFWMKSSVQTHINGNVQYFNSAWQSLAQSDLDLAADGVWREQLIRLNKPAGTTYVFVNMWLPGGITATIDDVTAARDNPAGAVEGFETASTGRWSTWYAPTTVLNTNADSHAGGRSVAISGNVKFGTEPFVIEAAFWHRRTSGSLAMNWEIQYFNKDWTLLSTSSIGSITSNTTWQQSAIPVSAPTATRYVLAGVWPHGTGAEATVNIDDFTTTSSVQPARRPFANASSWNTLAADLPSTLVIHTELDDVHWWVNLGQYSVPVVNSASGDPMVAVSVVASWGRPASTVNVGIPAGVTGAVGTDGHLQVNDPAGIAHSFWQFVRVTNTTATAQAYGSTPLDGDGFTDPATGLNAGTRAAMASTMAGLLTGLEIAAGEIEHALAVGLTNNLLKSGWVAPARSEDNGGSSAYAGSIPMGSRLVVPATASMPAGLSDLGQKLWRAAQRYGFLVVDRSGTPTLYADPRTMTSAQIDVLRASWCPVNCDGTSDLDLIIPQLQLAVH